MKRGRSGEAGLRKRPAPVAAAAADDDVGRTRSSRDSQDMFASEAPPAGAPEELANGYDLEREGRGDEGYEVEEFSEQSGDDAAKPSKGASASDSDESLSDTEKEILREKAIRRKEKEKEVRSAASPSASQRKHQKRITFVAGEEVTSGGVASPGEPDVPSVSSSLSLQPNEPEMEPFHLRNEMREGHFDESGNYVWNKHKKEDVEDEFMDGIDKIDIYVPPETEEVDEKALPALEALPTLIGLMQESETPLQTIKRLGRSDKTSFNRFTELADLLLLTYDIQNVYELRRDQLQSLYKTAFMKSIPPSLRSSQWEYRWQGQEEIYGPYATTQLVNWMLEGCFESNPFVRRLPEKGATLGAPPAAREDSLMDDLRDEEEKKEEERREMEETAPAPWWEIKSVIWKTGQPAPTPVA